MVMRSIADRIIKVRFLIVLYYVEFISVSLSVLYLKYEASHKLIAQDFSANIENNIIDYTIINYINSPLDQFEIRDFLSLKAPILFDIQLSITNIAIYLVLGSYVVLYLNLLATNNNKIASNSWSLSNETIYATVHSIVINQINNISGQIYFPFIYVLFSFILIHNLIGMMPYSFASTSHLVLTLSLSFTVVLGTTFLGFNQHGLKFFSLFVPAGCPLGLLPLLVLIEFISYLSRNVSLGLRLGANIK